MPAFLEDYKRFLGTGEVNEQGESLEAYLDRYDNSLYDNPSVTTDILVIGYQDELTLGHKNLKLLMIKRRQHPCIGLWALPGGFIEMKEDVEAAARRELEEETGIAELPLEQIYTWGEFDRDPRARIVTVSYLSLIPGVVKVLAGDDAKDAKWMDIRLELISQDENENRAAQRYQLQLNNQKEQIELTALIEVSFNTKGLIKEKHYRVIESNGIAFDHPRFILQALLYIEDCIQLNSI